MIEVPNLTWLKALEFLKELDLVKIEEDEIFDFKEVRNCDPFPMLITASAIRKATREADIKKCTATNLNNSYARHMRFYKAVGTGFGRDWAEEYGNSNYLPITKLQITDLRNEGIENVERIQTIIENKAKLMANVLSKDNDSFRQWLKYILTELMRNIPEHSKAGAIWYCAQYWPLYDLVELAILDEGIGIQNSLLGNYAYSEYVKNDTEAIRMALKPGISKAFAPGNSNLSQDEWANSGYGLYMVSQLCKKLGGSFIIASGDTAIKVGKGNIKRYDTKYSGTAIQIRIKPSLINDYQDVAKEILKQGEKQAKTSSNSFKSASKASKSLFWDGE